MIKAKKSLGQNFLVNEAVLKKIADGLDIASGDLLVEIGPGTGALTKHLLASQASRIIAIEKDSRLIADLKNKFPDPRLEIIEGDALEILPSLKLGKFKLIGNIPYYITGYLLRTVGELDDKPAVSVFVVQKEVAERAVATSPKSNLLSLSLRFWSKPEFLGVIKKENFRPAPKVDSAILRLSLAENPAVSGDRYYAALRLLFGSPRKTILNNLASRLPKEKAAELLSSLNLSPSLRPENLSLEEVEKIAERYRSNS